MRPSTLLCSGSNYRDHNEEKANTPISGKEPEFFVKTADCVVGPGEPIVYDPRFTKKLDCETELAIVIGKPGPASSRPHRALDHVFGYTIVNDVTARDRQVRRTPEGMTCVRPRPRQVVRYQRAARARASSPPTRSPIRRSSSSRPASTASCGSRAAPRNMIWTCAELIHFFSSNFTLQARAWSSSPARRPAPPGRRTRSSAASGRRCRAWCRRRRYCLPGDRIECDHREDRRAAQRGGSRLMQGRRRSRPEGGLKPLQSGIRHRVEKNFADWPGGDRVGHVGRAGLLRRASPIRAAMRA